MKKLIMMGAAAVLALAFSSCANKNSEASKSEDAEPQVEAAAQEQATAQAKDDAQGDALDADGYTTTASGLKYKVIRDADGPKPTASDIVTVHYEGRLPDGTVFDSSYARNEPANFPLQAVIAGWTEGLQLMPVGSKFQFYIPSDLAYGQRGAGGVIAPNQDLIFDVELISIN